MYSAELLEEARRMMFHMLSKVVEYGGSDLFISADFPPSIKHQGLMKPLGQQNLPSDQTKLFAYSLMNEKQRLEFETELECNFAISVPNVSRFRVNVFQQQLHVGMVIRTITAEIPNFTKLQLPTSLKDVIMEKRGLVLVVGGTGSGKSTSLAAMIDHRNENKQNRASAIKSVFLFPNFSIMSPLKGRTAIDDAMNKVMAKPDLHY
jgi:twitching motility protein PilU